MVEKQEELEITEETVEEPDKAKKSTKTEEIKSDQSKKINKYLKQENFTTKEGKELTVTFPGTEAAQDMIDDANSNEYQQQSLTNYRSHVLYLSKILEDDISIKDFEKELRKSKKTIEITDAEGNTAKYNLQFPTIGAYEQQVELRDDTGHTKDFNKFVLQHVLTKPLTIKYFDTHGGYLQLIAEANKFLAQAYNDSEYKEVMGYIDDFLSRMFL